MKWTTYFFGRVAICEHHGSCNFPAALINFDSHRGTGVLLVEYCSLFLVRLCTNFEERDIILANWRQYVTFHGPKSSPDLVKLTEISGKKFKWIVRWNWVLAWLLPGMSSVLVRRNIIHTHCHRGTRSWPTNGGSSRGTGWGQLAELWWNKCLRPQHVIACSCRHLADPWRCTGSAQINQRVVFIHLLLLITSDHVSNLISGYILITILKLVI